MMAATPLPTPRWTYLTKEELEAMMGTILVGPTLNKYILLNLEVEFNDPGAARTELYLQTTPSIIQRLPFSCGLLPRPLREIQHLPRHPIHPDCHQRRRRTPSPRRRTSSPSSTHHHRTKPLDHRPHINRNTRARTPRKVRSHARSVWDRLSQNSSNTENPHNNNNDQLSSDIEILSISKVQNLTRKGAKEPQEPPKAKETKEGEGKVGTKFQKKQISKGKGCIQEMKTKILGDQDILKFLMDKRRQAASVGSQHRAGGLPAAECQPKPDGHQSSTPGQSRDSGQSRDRGNEHQMTTRSKGVAPPVPWCAAPGWREPSGEKKKKKGQETRTNINK